MPPIMKFFVSPSLDKLINFLSFCGISAEIKCNFWSRGSTKQVLVGEKPFVHWRSKKQLRSAETMEQRRGARSSIRRIANCCAAAANAPRAALSLLPCAVLLPLLSCARRNYSQLSCLLCENEKSRGAHCGKSQF